MTWIVAVLMLLLTPLTGSDRWNDDCRGYGAERTIRCISVAQDPPGGVAKALDVWGCESGWTEEPPHSDSYHGPFQYLPSTYESQREQMPKLVRWYGLSPMVHDARSNVIMAVGYAARNGWGPWSCA